MQLEKDHLPTITIFTVAFLGLATLSPMALAVPIITLTPAYTAGCAGVASGHSVVINTGGPNNQGATGPSLSTVKMTGFAPSTAARVSKSSKIQTKSIFFVGPSPTGCCKPGTNKTLWANFAWNVSSCVIG
jgi:hypothetical protein